MKISLYTVLLVFTLSLTIGYTQENTPPENALWGLPDGAKSRLGKGEIGTIKFSPDGTLLAVVSSVGIWLYDVDTSKELALLPRHKEGFNISMRSTAGGAFIRNILAFSSDSKLLASASEDGTIRVFDVKTYTELRTLYKGEQTAVNPFDGSPYKSLMFSPDGNTLTSLQGVGERRLKVWDVTSGALLSEVSGRIGGLPLQKNDPGVLAKVEVSTDPSKNKQDDPLLALTLSPDGSTFAATKSTITVSNGIPDTEIKLGNVRSGELELPVLKIQSISPNTDPNQPNKSFYPIRDLLFSPDGTTLAGIEYSYSRERNKNSQRIRHTKIRLWYVSTGREVATILPQQSEVNPQPPIFDFSPDSRTLVTVDKGAPIQLWDVSTGKEISSINIPEFKPHEPWYKGVISSLAFHPNGNTLAVVIDETGNGRNFSLQLWNKDKGRIDKILISHPMLYTLGVAETILCMNAYTIEIRDINTGSKLQDVTKHWKELFQHFREIRPGTFTVSPNFAVAAIGDKGGFLELWDTQQAKRLRTLTGHTDNITAAAFSMDASKLASGSKDKSIRIWNTNNGKLLLTLTEHANSGKVQEFSNAPSQASAELIDNLLFSSDGNLLASSSDYGTIWLWDLNTGNLLKTITSHENVTDPIFTGIGPVEISLAFSPDDKLLASGNMAGGLILSDVHNDDLTQSLEPHTSSVLALAFSPDGTLLASGSRDTTIRIWNVETRNKITTLRGHTGQLNSLIFSEDSTTLVSNSMDGTLIFWDREKIVGLKK